MKILVTGNNGYIGTVLVEELFKKNYEVIGYDIDYFYDCNLTNKNNKLTKQIKKDIRNITEDDLDGIDIVIHLAGLSRPMSLHDRNINKSIDLNIIGTSNLVKACNQHKKKLIFFSTSYVYPGKKGNYKEHHPLLPFNNYAWSKLGGECAVQMLKNSLILRICMTEKPFVYKYAYTNLKTNFMYHENLAKVFFKLINKRGIINIGGPVQSVYNFAKKDNRKIKKKLMKTKRNSLPLNSTMNITKFQKFIKKN